MITYRPIPPEVFDEKQRPHISRLNQTIMDLVRLEGTLTTDPDDAKVGDSVQQNARPLVHIRRITPDMSEIVSGQSTVVGTPNLTFGLTNVVGSTTTVVSINSSVRFPLGPNSLWGRSNADVGGLSALDVISILGLTNAVIGPTGSTLNSVPVFSDASGNITDPNAATLTSAGSSVSLTLLQSASDFTIRGQNGGAICGFFGTDATDRGILVGGHVIAGQNAPAAPDPGVILSFSERMSQTTGLQSGIVGEIIGDSGTGGNDVTAIEGNVSISTDFNPGGGRLVGIVSSITGDATNAPAGTYSAIEGINAAISPVLTGNISTAAIRGANISISPILTSGSTVTVAVGVDVSATISGPTPTTAYGIRVQNVPASAGERAAIGISGGIKIAGTNRLWFGRLLGTSSTNAIYTTAVGGATLSVFLNSADAYEFSPTSFHGVSTGGVQTLGRNANGWSSVVYKDTSAAFEVFDRFASSPALSADRVFTRNLGNVDRTLGFTGSATQLDINLGDTPRVLDIRSGQKAAKLIGEYASIVVPTTATEFDVDATGNYRYLVDLVGMTECRLQYTHGVTSLGSTQSVLYIEGSSNNTTAGFTSMTASGLSMFMGTHTGLTWSSWQSLRAIQKVDGIVLRPVVLNTSGNTTITANFIAHVAVEFR